MKQSGRRIAAVVLALVLCYLFLLLGEQDQPDTNHDGQGTHGLRGLHHFVPGGSPRG